jgi:hypothetical protein
MSQKSFLMMFALAPTLLVGACGNVDEPDLDRAAAALTSDNGLSYNGMAYNGMAYNGLSFNGLSWNGLAYNGLAYNGLAFNGMAYNGLAFNGMSYNGMAYNGMSYNGLSEPVVQKFVSYLVGCALPPGDSVSYEIAGQKWTFAGEIGVAPEWKTGACGESCQRWISACMLSRLNKKGEHIEVSLRGEHRALKVVRHEERDMPRREATYYGNFFAGPGNINVCLSPGATAIPRVCGDDLAGCPMKVVGSCDRACRRPGPHGSFVDCGSENRNSAQLFSETVTVFLGRD